MTHEDPTPTLRLQPGLALVWRDPHTIQVGVDRPHASFWDAGSGYDAMLSALQVGAPRSAFDALGSHHGLTARQVEIFLQQVDGALSRGESARGSIVIAGRGPAASALAHVLVAEGHRVRIIAPDARPRAADIAVLIGSWVIDPVAHGAWLRRDIPHLPVVFGDETVTIGPLVEPGAGPCLYCVHRYRTDADPAWPAIASQLWGRPSSAETALSAFETASIVARLLRARLERGPGDALSVTLDLATGAREQWQWHPHPECMCLDLSAVRAPREIETASARSDRKPGPTTDAGAAVPA